MTTEEAYQKFWGLLDERPELIQVLRKASGEADKRRARK